jgi:hypothetical protein
VNLNEEKINADARRFLLGAMSDDERAEFELAFIGDEAMFDHVRAVEDDLVEQYVRGTMSSDDRRLFSASYSGSAANRERVDLTRAMLKTVSGRKVSERGNNISIWESITAFLVGNKLALGSAFAILAVAAGGWFALTRNTANEVAAVETPVVETRTTPIVAATPLPSPAISNNEIVAETNKPTPRNDNKPPEPPKVSTPVLALFAGSVRAGGSMTQLDLPKSASGARLLLNLESRDYERYSAEVVDPDGRVVARSSNIRANGKRVEVFVPASRLATGEYIVRLSGLSKENNKESVADFPFRAIKN